MLAVLAPVGSAAGKGALRVLRVSPASSRTGGEDVVLTCGYDSYDVHPRRGER